MSKDYTLAITIGGNSQWFRTSLDKAIQIQDDVEYTRSKWITVQDYIFRTSEIQAVGYWKNLITKE